MALLNKKILQDKGLVMKDYPERVLQFGEGNFLRAFVDWMIQGMNDKGLFGGRVVLVQPIAQGMAAAINEQNGLYTLVARGLQQGQLVDSRQPITCVSRALDPYSNYDAFMACADNPDLRFIVSNSTEAGISYDASVSLDDCPPASFPAKVCAFLYRRFLTFSGAANRGFVFLPCELIDRNGDKLKELVLRHASEWGLSAEFMVWVRESNYFTNTLVDRIVTGYPRDEFKKFETELGYEDKLIVTAEIFHSWVIEGDKKLARELPLTEAGFDVIWTDNLTPYRTRKVRILNGAHTMMVLAAYLAELDTVGQCMADPDVKAFMHKGVFDEILPTMDLPVEDLVSFAKAVEERFANPFIQHALLSISLNSTSKFKVRCLPSLLDYVERKGSIPKSLSFGLAALIAFYKGSEIREGALIGDRKGQPYKIQDDLPVLEFFRDVWAKVGVGPTSSRDVSGRVLANALLWDMDLTTVPDLWDKVASALTSIREKGMRASLQELYK